MTHASASAPSVVLLLVLMTFTKFICHSTQQYFYVIGTVNLYNTEKLQSVDS